MRTMFFGSRSLVILFALAPLGAVATAALAQQPQQQPPPPAPVKPYQALAFTMPPKMDDPSFDAFRASVAAAAAHKDTKALAKDVVTKGFFVEDQNGGNVADAKKSAFANFASAFDLNPRDDAGWDMLAGMTQQANTAPDPSHKGVVCAPALPEIDDKGFQALTKATGTDPSEWAFPLKPGQDVLQSADDKAPAVGKLPDGLVRMLPPDAPPGNAADAPQSPFIKVALPDGKTGFVNFSSLGQLDSFALCYVKQPDGWHMAGVVGVGGDQQ